MEYPTINDLPNKLLEIIFDHLGVVDLKNASMVCRRWSDLAFLGRRMDRVMLVPQFPWDKALLQSNRKYCHLELRETEKCSAYLKELFQTFSVSSLRLKHGNLSHSVLRSILLDVPNLQHLTIDNIPGQMNKMVEPLPIMRKLEHLENHSINSDSALPWYTIAPSLQGLKMCCDYEDQLEQWRLFSGQLKQVYASFGFQQNLLDRFCDMTFPLLEELSIKSALFEGSFGAENSFQRHEFFRRNASLRRLRLDGIYLDKTLVQDITNYNKKLMTLEIIGEHNLDREYEDNGEQGSLDSLAQLTELKHLRLQNLPTCIFREREALTSLQSLYMNEITFGYDGLLGFLRDLFEIAPQLKCLEVGSVVMAENAAQYICNNFKKLTRLHLTYSEKVTRDGLSGIDRLPFLWYLELRFFAVHTLFISIIPLKKVRYLTLHLKYLYNEDELLRLPEIFPQLDRLNLINSGKFLHESTVDKLRQLLPTCAIKIYGQLITNAGVQKCFPKWTGSEMMPVWEKEWVFKNRID
ncbi:uncharacterized protein LOC128267668 [Anopheles cruzii]|uniref:uncharacterized protein LOC128267668 n=1 Tax=Anopheles cruzii TaxID=68878 RepID=UPI0022EC1C46|nr:uncharacterized protein LOC128267668 [Anopheles cruzii]